MAASFYLTHTVIRKYEYLQRNMVLYFYLELCTKIQTWKVSPRQVDRAVNKTRRRRRRSSLLTTPIGQLKSGGCLLKVDQL